MPEIDRDPVSFEIILSGLVEPDNVPIVLEKAGQFAREIGQLTLKNRFEIRHTSSPRLAEAQDAMPILKLSDNVYARKKIISREELDQSLLALGQAIRLARHELGLSRSDLHRLSGSSRRFIANIERGYFPTTQPSRSSFENIEKLANTFGFDITEVMSKTGFEIIKIDESSEV